jgi:ADP-ribosylglycohydrolase
MIKHAYGGVISEYMAPGEGIGGMNRDFEWGGLKYHPAQKKGDQTNYGLYVLLVLEYFANYHSGEGPINFETLLPLWTEKVTGTGQGTWGALFDEESKQALEKYVSDQGKCTEHCDKTFIKSLGGNSDSMALRSPAALGVFADIDSLVNASDDLMFTHGNTEALAGGEFFTRLAYKIINTEAIDTADRLIDLMEESVSEMEDKRRHFCSTQLQKGYMKYEEAVNPSSPLYKEEYVDDLASTSMGRAWEEYVDPDNVGKDSSTKGTMPTSIYIILKYFSLYPTSPGKAFAEGVRANAMIGGDSASRSIAVGMVLGAIAGTSEVIGGTNQFGYSWTGTLNSFRQAQKWTNHLPYAKRPHSEL